MSKENLWAKLQFKRDIHMNEKQQRVEHNIASILHQAKDQYPYTNRDLAKFAGVKPSTISGWIKCGKALSSKVDAMISNIHKDQQVQESETEQCQAEYDDMIGKHKKYMEIYGVPALDNLSEFAKLRFHIKGLKQLGFDVTLTPIG